MMHKSQRHELFSYDVLALMHSLSYRFPQFISFLLIFFKAWTRFISFFSQLGISVEQDFVRFLSLFITLHSFRGGLHILLTTRIKTTTCSSK